jgi:MFS family permease
MRIASPRSILALLTALNFVNYVDRYLVAAVAPKFQEDLHLSEFLSGLVISAFMIGYCLTSPIFGRLGDRAAHRRKILIAVGVALWSLATVVSGLARNAHELILARIAVGVGEASYATLAPTIIDDVAPIDRKNRWLAIFYLAIPVGSGLGYVLGGFLQHVYGWRAAFFIAGGPGLLLALSALLIVEPRAKVEPTPAHRAPPKAIGALLRIPLFVMVTGGYVAYTFASGGFAGKAPAFLYSFHKMPLADADYAFGLIAVVTGILGTAIGGILPDRGLAGADEQTRMRRYLRFSGLSAAVALPFAIAAILAPTPQLFFAALFVCEVAIFASTSPVNFVTLRAVPPDLRATAMAASIFAIHVFGDLISPPLIGLIADRSDLRIGLSIVPVAIVVAAVVWFAGARKRAPVTVAHE